MHNKNVTIDVIPTSKNCEDIIRNKSMTMIWIYTA